jgi:23S rRNA (guanine745-N1)-methyltransferase
MPSLICPLCRLPIDPQSKVWRCAKGHSFDVAREGYVNLLPVQHKHSREPGDTPESLHARRDFLQAGHYQPLREAVLALLEPLQAQTLLDIGCGEGYYTSTFISLAADVTGLDIAKPAIQLAARRFRNVTWLVASGALLPMADVSLDLVTHLFTHLHVGELRRVVKPGGHVLVVTPGPQHLHSLRAALFEDVRAHAPDKFLMEFEAGFKLLRNEEVRFALRLERDSLRQLLQMTPYAWRAKPERRAALEVREALDTEAVFSLLLFRKD